MKPGSVKIPIELDLSLPVVSTIAKTVWMLSCWALIPAVPLLGLYLHNAGPAWIRIEGEANLPLIVSMTLLGMVLLATSVTPWFFEADDERNPPEDSTLHRRRH